MSIRILQAAAIAMIVSSHAFAQNAPPTPQQQTPLTCSDFHQNPNGSWSPNHPVTLNGVTMGAGVAFQEGVAFGGVDLAKKLNEQCLPH